MFTSKWFRSVLSKFFRNHKYVIRCEESNSTTAAIIPITELKIIKIALVAIFSGLTLSVSLFAISKSTWLESLALNAYAANAPKDSTQMYIQKICSFF